MAGQVSDVIYDQVQSWRCSGFSITPPLPVIEVKAAIYIEEDEGDITGLADGHHSIPCLYTPETTGILPNDDIPTSTATLLQFTKSLPSRRAPSRAASLRTSVADNTFAMVEILSPTRIWGEMHTGLTEMAC